MPLDILRFIVDSRLALHYRESRHSQSDRERVNCMYLLALPAFPIVSHSRRFGNAQPIEFIGVPGFPPFPLFRERGHFQYAPLSSSLFRPATGGAILSTMGNHTISAGPSGQQAYHEG